MGVVDRHRLPPRRRRGDEHVVLPRPVRHRRGLRRAGVRHRARDRRLAGGLPRHLAHRAAVRAADRPPPPANAARAADGHGGAGRPLGHGARAHRERRGRRLRQDRRRDLDGARLRRRPRHRARRARPGHRDPRRHGARGLERNPRIMAALIVLAVVALFVLFVAAKTIRIIPQARAGVVERLGRYSRTLNPGLNIVVPFVDRVKPLIDLREQVVSFQPQPVITEDNVTAHIDTVLYFTITEPKSATYEVAKPLQAIEQLTVTTLRNVVGDLTLEQTLTSRDEVNTRLRLVLDEATGKWGIRINRVEI